MHRVKIVDRRGKHKTGKALVGACTRVYLDGKLLEGVTRFCFTVSAGGIARVTIELVPETLEFDEPVEAVRKPTPKTARRRHYRMGQFNKA